LFFVTICIEMCVCSQILNLSKFPVYYCIQISSRKLQIMNVFLCCVFYSTKNISKTGIAFCWYCFRWDTARARHMYANNIGYVIMLITVNNWVFKFLWLGQFVMDYQEILQEYLILVLYKSLLHQHYYLNLKFIFIAQV
jgi:hypothetical protein